MYIPAPLRCLIALLALATTPLIAQSSHGYTVHKLVDSTSVDVNGAPLTGTPSDFYAATTDGTNVVFLGRGSYTFLTGTNGSSAGPDCSSSWSLYTMLINGGPITPLVTPATKVQPSEPDGLTASLCTAPTFWGGYVVYGANYVTVNNVPYRGFYRIPVSGGVSSDVLTSGDGNVIGTANGGAPPSSSQYASLYAPYQPLISRMGPSNRIFLNYSTSPDPYLYFLYMYQATLTPATPSSPESIQSLETSGQVPPCPNTVVVTPFNNLTLGRQPHTASTDGSYYAMISDGIVPATAGTGSTGLFISGSSTGTFGPCDIVVYSNFSYLTNSYVAFPGEAVAPGSTLQASSVLSLVVYQGKVYFAGSRKEPDHSYFSGIYQVDPNSIDPSSNTPIVTKLFTSLDSNIPGVIPPATCTNPTSTPLTPMFIPIGIYNNHLALWMVQNLLDCNTQAITPTQSILSYDLANGTLSNLLIIGAGAPANSPLATVTNTWNPSNANFSADGHFVFASLNDYDRVNGIVSSATLYSVYLGQAVTSLSLSAPSSAGPTPITLTAQLTVSSKSSITPTGIVHFYSGTALLGNVTPDATGKAMLTVAVPASGTLQAVYDGDANFMGADSNTVPISIGTPDYSIAVAPSSTTTIKAGDSATFTFTVTPSFGFSQPLSFVCSGLPANTKCLFSNPALTPNGSPATTTLTIQTNVPTATLSVPAVPQIPYLPFRGLPIAVGLLAAPLLLVRRRNLGVTLLAVFLLAASCLALAGCSGSSAPASSTTTSTTTPSAPVTPTGLAIISVSASATGGPSHAVSLNVTIQ